MRYYIIAGEASGDLHGANLIKELIRLDPGAVFRCWGGDRMEAYPNVTLVKHYRDLAFMGFIEVLQNIRTIYNNIEFCKKDLLNFKPDVLILIDYPGFNLRIAEFAKKEGIRVFYYISPQIWAWKQSRVHKIKRCVDRMFVILPFEKAFYEQFDYEVDFVGHPLLDALENKEKMPWEEFRQLYQLEDRPVVALLPGSRKQEISVMLPQMLTLQADFPDYQFVIAVAPSMPDEFYYRFEAHGQIRLVRNNLQGLLQHARAALVTSGTATLETALLRVPQVVCYKGSSVSYAIARRLVKVNFISLVNLIMEKEIVKELIQDELNRRSLKAELYRLLSDEKSREEMLKNYEELIERLGGQGASENTARLMIRYLKA